MKNFPVTVNLSLVDGIERVSLIGFLLTELILCPDFGNGSCRFALLLSLRNISLMVLLMPSSDLWVCANPPFPVQEAERG